jgi:ATP-dependent DNA helicase Rep
LASLGEFASRWKTSLFEALFAESLGAALSKKAIGSLHEFGRYVNDLEHRARHTSGAEDAKALLLGFLKDIGYEQHLFDGEDREKLAAARWSNVLDFVDWIARRCGGEITPRLAPDRSKPAARPSGADGEAVWGSSDSSGTFESERQSVLQVAQTISVIISLAERGDERDVVTLSTLHAAKGLEWPHVVLAGVVEGLLPFRSGEEEMTPQRLEEERRLMYVGITRARSTLAVSSLRRRKRGRETVAAVPSRFVKEMRLDEQREKVDPRERLKAQRAALAAKIATAPVASE